MHTSLDIALLYSTYLGDIKDFNIQATTTFELCNQIDSCNMSKQVRNF